MTTTTALAVAQPNMGLSLLLDPQRFDHLQRVGKMLALSPLFPEHLRKGGLEAAIANGALVLNMAHRLNEDPLTVAQNIYFVGGKPGWATSYMIGKVRQHGVFRDPIDWEETGSGDTLSVTAFAVLAATGRRVTFTCDMAMAKAEGWTKNPKYQSMPKVMLRYRSAAFLIRLYCPDVMIGIPLQVEQELQMRDVTPDDDGVSVIQANDDAPIEVKATPDPTKEPAKTAAKPQPEPEPQRTSATDKAEDAPQPDAAPEVDEEQFRGLLDLMLADLDQSGPDETEQVYAAQIEQMKACAPDCYRQWQDALTKAREASA